MVGRTKTKSPRKGTKLRIYMSNLINVSELKRIVHSRNKHLGQKFQKKFEADTRRLVAGYCSGTDKMILDKFQGTLF